MTTDTTLEEAVTAWADEPDTDDRVIELVAEHGVYDADSLTPHEISLPDRDTISVYAGADISSNEINAVTAFVKEYEPRIKQCYTNAAELARFDERFKFVEGVTANDETGHVHNHAWNSVNGTPVDVTRQSSERYGVHIPNTVLRDVLPSLESENRWDFLANPAIPSKHRPPYTNDTESNPDHDTEQ